MTFASGEGPAGASAVTTGESAASRCVFQLRMEPSQLERWKSAARDREVPLARLVRDAVEEELGGGFEEMLARVRLAGAEDLRSR